MFNLTQSAKRLTVLEEDFRKLKREFDSLELEWSNAYDKFRQIVQRIAKRAEIAQRAESPGAVPGTEGGHVDGTNPLSVRQSEFQQRIMARRNRLASGGQG